MYILIPILIIIFLAIVSLVIVLGVGLLIGWLLTLVLPFTLFEATVLGIISSAIAAFFWFNMVNRLGFNSNSEETNEEDEYDDYDTIPADRFYKKSLDRTWEAWIRYQISNGIYVEFQDSPSPVAPLDKKQLQELSIRLADITISLLKAKTARVRKLKVTVSNLKKEMTKMGQRPYDNDILKMAAEAINEDLEYHYDDIITIIKTKLWSKQCDMFDWQ